MNGIAICVLKKVKKSDDTYKKYTMYLATKARRLAKKLSRI